MRIPLDVGRERIEVEARDADLIAVHRPPAPEALTDPRRAVREVLEHPTRFEPLRRALTPDDRLTVVIDERLPRFVELLSGLLDHVTDAGVRPENITLLSPPAGPHQGWLDDLPDEFQDVRLETHNPADRQRLAYLATTRKGRRVYLNRSAVEADQLIVLSGRRYDPVLGYAGAEAAVFPALGDEATRQEFAGRARADHSGDRADAARAVAVEVAWLLGAPFFVQAVEGPGDEVARLVAGLAETSAEGERLLDAGWRGRVDRPARTVVATLSGDPARHGFAELAQALACAARVVEPDGRIAILSRAEPALGEGAAIMRQAEEPGEALKRLADRKPADVAWASQWARAADRAKVYLLSGLDVDVAEELFATPLDHPGQVQRLLDAEGSCLILPDAHKSLIEM
jgi:nickel-dependent lactate racemase